MENKRLSPSAWVENKVALISPVSKVATISAFFVGIVTHLAGITNYFHNHDSIMSVFGMRYDLAVQGKWFSRVIENLFFGEVASPSTAIVVGLLFIAVSAGITVAFLGIESKVFAALIGAMMTTFPTVVCTNSYLLSSVVFFALYSWHLCVSGFQIATEDGGRFWQFFG